MTDAMVREKLVRIAGRPSAEWARRLELEFPDDPALRAQALLWLHAEREGPGVGTPSLGEAADERYELSVRLDTSAASSVWQAFDHRLGRNVAIKVFHDRDRSEALDQVLAEARAASDVVSEHVVRVLDVQYGDGQPYIVMELVAEYDPEKGDVVLGATAAACAPADMDEVARWVMQVARGVHEAHLRNVFHRDLKPKNVLITPNSRRARVTDFGLAISERSPCGPVSVRGTPEYMAPEQARGLSLTLDPRNANDRVVLVAIDVWGLGAIAYHLLSGRPPWLPRKADDLSAWEVAASRMPPPPLERTRDGQRIPRRLRRIVDKAMAADPHDRYASAALLAGELAEFLAKRPTTLDRSHLLRVALWCRRNPQLATSIGIVLGLAAGVVGTHVTVTHLRDERATLDKRVKAQKAEKEALNHSVMQARGELHDTREKLRAERDSLAALEKSLAEERASYQTLIEAKEQALLDATRSTRKLMEQLESAKRDQKATEQARAAADDKLAELRRELDRIAKERDKLRRERDTARTERDQVTKERDAALAEHDQVEQKLQAAETHDTHGAAGAGE